MGADEQHPGKDNRYASAMLFVCLPLLTLCIEDRKQSQLSKGFCSAQAVKQKCDPGHRKEDTEYFCWLQNILSIRPKSNED